MYEQISDSEAACGDGIERVLREVVSQSVGYQRCEWLRDWPLDAWLNANANELFVPDPRDRVDLVSEMWMATGDTFNVNTRS